MSDCLLSYALTTVPAPLTASPPHVNPGNEDELSYGSVDIVISNSGSTPIRCSRIAFVLRVGRLAQDLALRGEGIAPYVEPSDAWTVVGPQPDVLVAVPSADTAVFPAAGDSSTVRFSVEPISGASEVTVDGLYVTLKNIPVSDKTGVSYIEIEEWATTGGEIPTTPNSGSLEVAKFPFRSGADPSPGVGRALVALESNGGPPATRINARQAVRLEWNHLRGDGHELYMDGARVWDDSIGLGSAYDIPAGTILRDVAVALKTSTPTPDGGFVTRWDHLTVCVTDQRLASLDVTNALTADGPVQANNQLTVTNTLTANGQLKANNALTIADGQTLTAGGPIQANDQLTVTNTLTANGQLKANNALTIADGQTLTAGGPIEANSDVTVRGTLNVAGALTGVSVTLSRTGWSGKWKESEAGEKEGTTNQVLVGRYHSGDENGNTAHRYATLQVKGPR
ncbi:hypothetical protein [Streptomyces lavendulae]|uniref:hypothetical protein n=1 Tax=Streptomyces lavendulae TaxID=1914 RepID=UPI003808835B